MYIPPHGELRGGSWVVVDPTINEEMMEMYAECNSRGGILEPPGICDIKFRKPDLLKLMARNDPVLRELSAKIGSLTMVADIEACQAQIDARQEALLPLYLQVAYEFADLHDRPGRMKAKGVIREVVPWETSRTYFYWRAHRDTTRARRRGGGGGRSRAQPRTRARAPRATLMRRTRGPHATHARPSCDTRARPRRRARRRLKRRLAEAKAQAAFSQLAARKITRAEVSRAASPLTRHAAPINRPGQSARAAVSRARHPALRAAARRGATGERQAERARDGVRH